MDLILAEKPSQARAIAYALSANERRTANGVTFFVGKNVVVASAVGHLFTLEPIKAGWTYPKFEFDWTPTWRTNKGLAFVKGYFDCLKTIIHEFAFSSFVIGCDFDIEGSLIGYIAFKMAGVKDEKMRRMKMQSLTKSEISRAYSTLSPPDFEWIEAGHARHQVDATYGINLTTLMSKVVADASNTWKLVSMGRVQSPTLKFVVDRERAITNFVPEKYWVITATLIVDGKKYIATHKLGNIKDEKLARQIFERCKDAREATVFDIDEKTENLWSPLCFSLPVLQREAWRVFHFPPAVTDGLAQKLYQQILTSYPRTGTTAITGVPFPAILETLAKNPLYQRFVNVILSQKYQPRFGGVSDGAHIALTPTPELGEAKVPAESRLLDLIRRRFLATFYPPAKRKTTAITFDIKGEPFILSGTKTVERGWLEPYQYLNLPEEDVPTVRKGDVVNVQKVSLDEKFTKPLQRYTLASIIQEMERHGIGTKATRSEICQKLLRREYIILERSTVKPTFFGMCLITVAEKYCPLIINVELTKELERDLEKIEKRQASKDEVVQKALWNAISIIDQVEKRRKEIGTELASTVSVSPTKKRGFYRIVPPPEKSKD
jgi:DNA topoisomerase-1